MQLFDQAELINVNGLHLEDELRWASAILTTNFLHSWHTDKLNRWVHVVPLDTVWDLALSYRLRMLLLLLTAMLTPFTRLLVLL